MVRVKPRGGSKRGRSSSSGCDEEDEAADQELAALEGDLQADMASEDDEGQQQGQQLGADASDSRYEPAGQRQPQAFVPRSRSRKRKQQQAAADGDSDAAAGSGSRPGKRTRGAGGGAGVYTELDDDAFEYAFASSEEPEEEPPGHADAAPADQNESHCRQCGSDAQADKLLCCEHCPAVYHLYCLDPPLPRVPRGAWLCPQCAAADALLDDVSGMERVLAVREQQQQQQGAEEDTAKPQQRQQQQQQQHSKANGKQPREFFVKWKDRSYLHCSWVSEEIVNRACAVRVVGQANPVVARLRKFWRDQAAAAESLEAAEAEEAGESVHGMNPAWVQVDRVLAERCGPGRSGAEGRQYLVAWQQLPLEQASWEEEEDLASFAAEIAAYHDAQTPIAAEAAARAKQQAQQAREARDSPGGTDIAAAAAAAAAMATGERGSGARKFEATPDFVAGGPLHPYQLEGLNWLYHKAQVGDNVILADEMGLGKTIQSIAFLGALWKDCVRLPHLVVVPLTTLSNWERELATWAPYLRVVSLHGSAASRQLLLDYAMFAPGHPGSGRGRTALQDRVKFHVLLTTYEMVSKHLADIRRLDWCALLVDEAHRLKNANSRLFQDLLRVPARHRVLLTGTPLQNSLEELFFLMNFLEPAKFSSLEDFKQAYAALDDKDKVAELHRQLAPHLLRRLKKDVLKQLPPKMEQIVRVELSEEQRQLYKAILSKNYDALVDKSKSVVRLRNVMMELRKAVNHPCLASVDLTTPAHAAAVARRQAAAAAAAKAVADAKAAAEPGAWPGPPPCEETEQLVAASGKLALLDRMMVRLRAGGHRVLIYSQFTRTLDVLEDWVAGRGWGYERIDGDVSGLERQRRVDAFNSNAGGNKFVFLLSTRAGGLGINLATADTVIIYDSDWNPHNDLQALARAHRMGQQRSVMVFRLVARATVEERMLQRAKSKMVLEHLVVAKAARADKLAQAELDDILRYGAKELFAEDEEEAATAAATGGAEGADGATATADPAASSEQQQPDGDKAGEGGAAVGKSALRIVWDDAALDRLLDRSQVQAAAAAADGEEAAAAEDDEFTKAFKVANFDMVVEEEAPPEPEQQQQQQQQANGTAAAAGGAPDDLSAYDPAATELHKSQQAFWAAILGARQPEGDAAAGGSDAAVAAALGGLDAGRRRARNAARYIYFDSESEADSDSGSAGDDGYEEGAVVAEGGGLGGKRKRGRKKRPDDDDVEYEAAVDEQEDESEELLDDADGLDALLLRHAPAAAAAAGNTEAAEAAAAAVAAAGAAGAAAKHGLSRTASPAATGTSPPPATAAAAAAAAMSQQQRLAAERAAAAAVVAATIGRQRSGHAPLAGPAAGGAAAANAAPAGKAGQQQQQQQAGRAPGQLEVVPRVTGSGPAMRICGLNSSERQLFMSVLMHFGPPFIHRQPDLGWAPYEQHLTGKTRSQLAAYLLVLLEHLADCATDACSSHGSSDYLPHPLLLVGPRGALNPTRVWDRLTALSLLASKMWQHGSRPAAAFVIGGLGGEAGRRGGAPLYRSLSGRPNGWGHAQDFGLVRGIFLAGYECWSKILGLQSLALKPALRIELGLPPDYDSPQAAAQAAQPPPDTPPGEAPAAVEAQQAAYSRMVAANRKKEVDWLDKRARQIVTALKQEYASGQGSTPAAQQRQPQQVPQQGAAAAPAGGRGAAPSRMQQAAAQAQAAQLMQQQQQQRAKQPQLQPLLPAGVSGPGWRSDVVRMYNAMKAKLRAIKDEASTAMRHDRPDDAAAMQSAAEQFRISVRQLQHQAGQLEQVLATLLPQQGLQQRGMQQQGQPGQPAAGQRYMQRGGLPPQQQQQQQQARMGPGPPGVVQQQLQQQQRMAPGRVQQMPAGAPPQQQQQQQHPGPLPVRAMPAPQMQQQQPMRSVHHAPGHGVAQPPGAAAGMRPPGPQPPGGLPPQQQQQQPRVLQQQQQPQAAGVVHQQQQQPLGQAPPQQRQPVRGATPPAAPAAAAGPAGAAPQQQQQQQQQQAQPPDPGSPDVIVVE